MFPAFKIVLYSMLKEGLIAGLFTLLNIMVVSGKNFPSFEPLSDEMIDYINFKAKTTWKV